MVSGLSLTVVNLTDTVFISRLGNAALGGVGNGSLLHLLFALVGFGMATGIQIILARRHGEGQYNAMGITMIAGGAMLMLLSIVFITFIFAIMPSITPLFVSSTGVENVMLQYLKIRSLSLPLTFLNATFTAYYIGTTHTRIIGRITPLAAILNIGADYLFIFGAGIIPAFGIAGAAWASNLSELFTFLIFAWLTLPSPAFRKRFVRSNLRELAIACRSLLRISSPLMAQNFMSFLAWFAFFSFIETLGESELAVSHMVRAVYMLLIIPVFGLGDATNSLVSNLLGQQRPGEVFTVLKRVIVISLLIVLAVQPVYWLGYRQIFSLFGATEQQADMGKIPLLIVFTSLFLFSTVIMGFRAIAGTGKTAVCLWIEGISVSLYIYCVWWLCQRDGATLNTVWLAEYIYFGIFGILVFTYLKFGKWQLSKV